MPFKILIYIKKLMIWSLVFHVASCSYEPLHDDASYRIFDQQAINFRLSDTRIGLAEKDNQDSTLGSGRLALKRITLPSKNKYRHAKAIITLVSKGDPWDKSGSFFLLPSSGYSLIEIEAGTLPTSWLGDTYPGITKIVNDKERYDPPIEILRFITPFGIGHFNEHENIQARKPVYIPRWEDDVTWSEDVSHLLPLLEGEVTFGIFIDTWSDKGWQVDVTIEFSEPIRKRQLESRNILSLVNTTPFVQSQKGYDLFSIKPVLTFFEIENETEKAYLYYLTTGHGGHEGGDEFVKRVNVISLNDRIIEEFTPWRDDCASLRRFNPHAGVWTETTEWKGEQIEERIASSDYSRSGWCPGDKVSPRIISLGRLKKGIHELKILVKDAQITTESEFNFWNISAYLVY